MGKYKAKLIILWYDNFGETKPVCRGMAWLPFQKTMNKLSRGEICVANLKAPL